jgi:pimeloyl-ACP methyl ester carboxylesterase
MPIAGLRSFLLALSAAALIACGRNDPRPVTAAAEAPTAPEPVARATNSGQPRIAMATDGVHIEYRVRGQGKPLVVLVHGWSCDSNYWRGQLADLTSRYTVMTVDLAGHGASGRNRSDWSMRQFGADVAAAVRTYWDANATAPREVVLVGHSMGGPVAVEAQRQLGAAVLGIIGVDTFKTFGLPQQGARETNARLAAFEKDFIGATRQIVTNSFFKPNANPAFVRQIADDMSAAPPEVAIPAIRGLNSWNEKPDLADVKVPIIAINGDMAPMDDARSRKVAPTFRSIVIADRGHFLMMEDPAGFNPVLLREIDVLTAQDGGS